MKTNSSGWKNWVRWVPAVGILCALAPLREARADAFDDERARYAKEECKYRRAEILRRVNTPSIVTGATTSTVVTARDAAMVALETNYLAIAQGLGVRGKTPLEAAAILKTAFDAEADAKKATKLTNGAVELIQHQLLIQAMGGNPFAVSGAASVTNTVVTEQRISPAMQRLGRTATAEDMK